MNKKWCLLKASDGQRGENGKQKVYEVTLDGNVVTFSWGMAEMGRRQTQRKVFYTPQAALVAAYEKVSAKCDRGYRIAFAA